MLLEHHVHIICNVIGLRVDFTQIFSNDISKDTRMKLLLDKEVRNQRCASLCWNWYMLWLTLYEYIIMFLVTYLSVISQIFREFSIDKN